MKKGTDRGMRRWRAIALVAAGLAIGVTMMATPAMSHVGGTVGHLWNDHIRPRADARYINVGEKASDADKLDALDSTAFWQKTEGVNAATLGGTAPTGFIRKSEAFSHVQITSNLGAGGTHNWFTHSWPANLYIDWQARPTTQGGRLRTSVEIERGASGTFTYHISVVNVSAVATDYELRAYRFPGA